MEINAEINKIFGTEMAKLFAEQISEEELRDSAIKSYNKLRTVNRNPSYFGSSDSDFDNYLRAAILDRFKEEVNKYLQTEQIQIDIQKEAEKLVNDVRERAREKILERASNALVEIYTGSALTESITILANDLRRYMTPLNT